MRQAKMMMVFLLVLILSIPSSYAQGIGVVINQNEVVFTEGTGFPFIDANSRTLVPFRAALEAFGCQVAWNQQELTAIAEKENVTVKVPIGKAFVLVNGVKKPNDTAAQIRNGRTYLPIRAVLEGFGAKVEWSRGLNAVLVTSPEKSHFEQMERAAVEKVIDGDTFLIATGETVRIIGVDTPEVDGPYTDAEHFGAEASAYTKGALTGKTVYLDRDISDTDKYGRLLRYVYLEDGTFFNLVLVQGGFAEAKAYPPDVRYADVLNEAERTARMNGAGLWKD